MGKPVSSDVKRVETTGFNTKINKDVFKGFKDHCAYIGYPMNVMLETFMRQYSNGRFKIDHDDIMKFKNDGVEVDTLNTYFDKEIYLNFKSTCKADGFFVKHVVTAFMEKVSKGNLILEYVSTNKVNAEVDKDNWIDAYSDWNSKNDEDENKEDVE